MNDNLKIGIVILLGVFICVQNWFAWYANHKHLEKRSNHSTIPFIGGIVLCFGISLIKSIQEYWLIGLVIDPTIFIMWVMYVFTRKK